MEDESNPFARFELDYELELVWVRFKQMKI